jgi:hypothetical protein
MTRAMLIAVYALGLLLAGFVVGAGLHTPNPETPHGQAVQP